MIEIIYTLIVTQITIACVTLFLHRSQTHRAVSFHPAVNHFMRFWLWLTTGMITKQWVAIHRKHHRYSDNPGDPHSPWVFGLPKVLFFGAKLYHDASKEKEIIEQYGIGTPDDWIEQNIYTKHNLLGIMLMLLIDLVLFGLLGLMVWGIQMIWIPFWAAGVINGVGHFWGYRNGETRDHSKNIIPWGLIIGGEELHNNHHLAPASAKLSKKWFEFDLGWLYIKLLAKLRLANLTS
jgi:stearoyl-CoA desaturase (delta-9 desaturase)